MESRKIDTVSTRRITLIGSRYGTGTQNKRYQSCYLHKESGCIIIVGSICKNGPREVPVTVFNAFSALANPTIELILFSST